MNIDGNNPLYWKKSAKIHVALKDFDQASFAFKQAVDLGNYELDTWLKWAKVAQKNGDLDGALQILKQGKEFYPKNLKILYMSVGFLLLIDDRINARITMLDALRLDKKTKKIHLFQNQFPQFWNSEWLKTIVTDSKKA